MARQENEGWPLGLQPLNVRVGGGGGGIRATHYFGSMSSSNTVLSASPTSSTDSSSDLDTESTGSFFRDRSITLGSLIGVSSILDLSRRSIRGRRQPEPNSRSNRKPCNKSRTTWLFSLCSRDSCTDVRDPTNPPSLGHFLAVERRSSLTAATTNVNNTSLQERNSQTTVTHNAALVVPDEISIAQPSREINSLFVNGSVAPPSHHHHRRHQSSPLVGSAIGGSQNRSLEHGIPVLLSCVCGQVAH